MFNNRKQSTTFYIQNAWVLDYITVLRLAKEMFLSHKLTPFTLCHTFCTCIVSIMAAIIMLCRHSKTFTMCQFKFTISISWFYLGISH